MLDSTFVIVIDIFCLIKGKIACANVLSDLYAMGVTECDNMLMLLAISTKMSEKEKKKQKLQGTEKIRTFLLENPKAFDKLSAAIKETMGI